MLTQRGIFISELLTAIAVISVGYVLFVGTWYALGGV